jgi:hypothetical protein
MRPRLLRLLALGLLVAIVAGAAGCAAATSAGLPAGLLVAALAGLLGLGCNKQSLSLDGGGGAAGDGGGADRVVATEGGAWQTCCENGRISSCYCGSVSSCNYGLGLIQCGDGRCGYGQFTCTDAGVDAAPDGPPDAQLIVDALPDGGRFVPCCVAGRVDSCYCGPLTACNYAPFQTCAGGACYPYTTFPPPDGGICPADAGGGQ